MYGKDEIGPVADRDDEHETDHDPQSLGHSEVKPISDQTKHPGPQKEAGQFSADDLWLDAMTRVAIAVKHHAEAGTKPSNSGAESSGRSGSEAAYSAGDDKALEPESMALPEAAASSDETDLLDIVRRQWRLIGAIIGIVTIVGAALLSQLTPLYTATAKVIIEPQRALPALEAILPAAGTDEQSIETEVAVLTSGVLLDSVIDRLDLASDPEFNGSLNSSEPDVTRTLTKSTLFSRLEVAPVGAARVIAVHATAESSSKAAMIANTLVDSYLNSRQESKFQASSEMSAQLEKRIADLQAELRDSEERVERFRSEAELLEAGGTTLISQQLINLNSQLISARAETAAARAELSQVSALINSSDSSSLLASAGVLSSPIVQELRKQQVTLEREIAELSSEYGPSHPRMRQLKADAADLTSQISIEVNKVVQGLRNSVQVAKARELDLERESKNLTSRLSETNEDEIGLRALEREASANQQLLETLLARRKALGSPDLMQAGQPDARVLSYAAPPLAPSFPQFGISIAGIFTVAMIAAFVVAFIREIRRRGISTLEQLEAISKLRALAFVPRVASRRQRRGMLVSVLANSRSPFPQAMKTLSWQLDESMPEGTKVIVVTSPIPGEGKTTTATAIARIRAAKGHKTIIVDADIRNPNVHKSLNCKPTTGLTDVIKGDIALADAIIRDNESTLQILPAGRASADSLDMIDSPVMSALLDELNRRYDYVIVDTPPIAAAPDACILSKTADTTILVVRASTTPANAVKYALRTLKRNGGHITGTVLTMVETTGSINRNYGYYGYYGYYGEKA